MKVGYMNSKGLSNQQIEDNLDILSRKEAKILNLRFGIKGNSQHTLESIGRKLHLSRQRVCQIKKESIGKIAIQLTKKERRVIIKPISEKEAEKQGFVPITDSFIKKELPMLKEAIKQLGGLAWKVSKSIRGLKLCRLKTEVEELYSQ